MTIRYIGASAPSEKEDIPNTIDDFRKFFLPGNEERAMLFRKAASLSPSPMAEFGATQDPVATAKAIPAITGTIGAMSGVPFGTVAGTVGGRQISNALLRSVGKGKEIPSTVAQVGEGVLSGVGDLAIVPWINRIRFGKEIGWLEKQAGVPKTVESLKRVTGPASTVKFIDSTLRGIGEGKIGVSNPTLLKQIKDQLDFIRKNRKAVPLTDNDMGKLKMLNRWVQDSLGKAISGRAEAAKSLAMSQSVPRAIKNTWAAVPRSVKWGLGAATGASPIMGSLYRALGGSSQTGQR